MSVTHLAPSFQMPLQTLWMGTTVKLLDFVEVETVAGLVGIYQNLSNILCCEVFYRQLVKHSSNMQFLPVINFIIFLCLLAI